MNNEAENESSECANPLTLTGTGYSLAVTPEAEARKKEALAIAARIERVSSNDESAAAQFAVRSLAGLRIAVEKARKEIKKPVLEVGKKIDKTASDFLADVDSEEARIKRLVGAHAEEVERLRLEKEEAERKAFEEARQAREIAEKAAEKAAETGRVSDLVAARAAEAERAETLAARLEASNEVHATRVADGVRFALDFEVDNAEALYTFRPDLVELTPKRAEIMRVLKAMSDGGISPCLPGVRVFRKPVVSSR